MKKLSKKLRHRILISIAFLTIVFFILLKVFTGFLGPPDYVYLYSYNHNTKGGFVKPEDVYKVSVYNDYNRLKIIEFGMKHCNNISEISTFGDHFENLDFLKGQDNLKYLKLSGECDDWSELANHDTVEDLSFIATNLSDTDFLQNFTKLKYINIWTNETIKYSNFETLSSLEYIHTYAPNVDLKEISKASGINKIYIDHAEDIKNASSVLLLDNIRNILIFDSIINEELLSIIPELHDMEEIYISNCTYSGDESEAKKIIKILTDKGLNAKIEDGIISISNS